MALSKKDRGHRRSGFLFWIRLLGLTGLLVAAVGVVLAGVDQVDWNERIAWLTDAVTHGNLAELEKLGWGERLALGGALVALIALAVEVRGLVALSSGRRGAFGTIAAVQTLLALLLVVGVNVYSFEHYLRFDWTRDGHFTLSSRIREELGRLRGDTTIVVYQRHKTFGQLSDKPDAYDYAAERKVVEKVKDLVEQFRELGRQFNVVVLDVEEEGFDDKLAELGRKSKALKQALDTATENSIFFQAGGLDNDKVQRLSFHDIFQLDKQASQERGNLVLLDQGVKPFADKVLYIDEKRPKIAVATVHEVLSLEGSEELGMTGVKKTLSAHGFDTRDLILKKWNELTGPESAVLTFDESKNERLEDELTELDAEIKGLEKNLKQLNDQKKAWESRSLDQLTKDYARQLDGDRVTEDMRKGALNQIKLNVSIVQLVLDQNREERTAVLKEKSGLNVEGLEEQRRIADLKAKANRMLADCDLLIIPRMTLFNVARSEYIPNRVYRLDDAQVSAIKDFLKAGKPVLALFGPGNEPPGRSDPLSAGPDKLEDALSELGIKMPNQTVLFNVESKSFGERRGGLLVLGANVEVPPVEFDWPAGAGQTKLQAAKEKDSKPNEIRESMRLTARGLGKDQTLDLRVRHPRPVYFEPAKGRTSAFAPEFMMTNAASWNDSQPFPTREHTPRYEPPKTPSVSGNLEEMRRGPFPIGVAVETTVPATWYAEKDAKPASVRIAAIGQGGVFIGTGLPAVKEKLLLDVCNWLLGRDDLLTRAEHHWSYPRVVLAENDARLWQWGTRLGLPLLFVYFGLVVLLVRRLR